MQFFLHDSSENIGIKEIIKINCIIIQNCIMSIIKYLFLVAWKPVEVYTPIITSENRKRKYCILIFSILILLIFQAIVIELTTPLSLKNTITNFEYNQMNTLQYEKLVQTTKMYSQIFSPFMTIFALMATSFLAQMIFNIFANKNISYFNTLLIVSIASICDCWSYIIRLPFMIYFDTTRIYFGLMAFINQENNLMCEMLKQFDLLILWKFVIIGVGVSVYFSESKKKKYIMLSIIILLIYSLLVSLLRTSTN